MADKVIHTFPNGGKLTRKPLGIRELQKQKDEALERYHAECARIDAEIDAIRKKRGTKLKDPTLTENDCKLAWQAEGRARRTNPHGE